mmetsp:Transcript_18441/g.39885  ORF Transcript_18441/g.39885 Transcript_18441/m.39885 type:complete len:940 (-) Transcript_18441:58-2877(-)|eukprot:CAMPEP_0172298146 /NCGR_PEP_ID=MMETSP1058-20130122/925_1 /TAXON_ID=83371 /ORGANISM="Detonula confervacea, Strain CCMP 353" /LENGTH=939 /DNA_ID=CAMNT_0013007391 /DNA_START=362 /DNA_END=3181 /DNA_ORIENTATION=-
MNQAENQEEQSQIAKGQNSINNGDIPDADGPNGTTTEIIKAAIVASKEQDTTDNAHGVAAEVSISVGVEDKQMNAKDAKSAPSSASANSSSRSVHQESVDNNVATDKKSVDPTTEPQARVTEEASSQSSAAENKDDQVVKSRAAETTEESSSVKEDMEIDEINTGSSSTNQDGQDSDNSANNKKTKSEAMSNTDRRSSKRHRTSASNRYSPGEGGGLASKKPKVNNGNGATGPGDASKDAAPKAPPGDTKITVDEKASRREKGGDKGSMIKSPPRERLGSRYRWIDEGVKSNVTPSLVEHEGVEIDFTNSKTTSGTPPPPFVVRCGDVVMLSSSDAPRDDKKQQSSQGSHEHQAKREVVPIYNDPASREAGLGALDPFIGCVERLWEEVEDSSKKGPGQRRKKGKNAKSTKSSRMLIRTRWFFKKEDLEGIKGSFVVEGGTNNGTSSKDEILATMTSQDLVLTDKSDDNVISTILGKVKVVERKPLDQSKDVEMTDAKGTFISRYNLSFCPAKSSGEEATVKLSPCTDGDFKATIRKESKGIDSSDPTSTDDDGYTSAKDEKQGGDNYAAPFSASPFPMSPRRVVSEGLTTVGKIKVGPNHQAVIPAQLDLARKTSFRGLANPPSQRIPTMVWDPATDEGDDVDEFLDEACSLLSNHMKLIDLEPFLDANYVEAPNAKAEAKRPREINIDCLLTELHECKGDVRKAIKKISGNPEKYLTIWNKKNKDQFDTSYRAYRESIRMIANSLGEAKSCKDTVDYQYRYKFVENFRRFMGKKREKAEEIMASVEDRMLNEKMKADAKSQDAIETDVSSSEEEEGKISALIDGKVGSKLTGVPATHVGPVNNRVRTWFRTGGGDKDAVGATQQRRNLACDFLTQVMEKVGREAYVMLAKSIKACNSSQATDNLLSDVKATAKDILKSHPDLLGRFITFLPEEFRCN